MNYRLVKPDAIKMAMYTDTNVIRRRAQSETPGYCILCYVQIYKRWDDKRMPVSPRPWGKVGVRLLTTCPFKPAGDCYTGRKKRNTCKTDLHISRIIIKSDMNNESAWPVAFTATTPDTRSNSTILYCLFSYIYIAVKQACRVLTGDPLFMQHMYWKCVYISFVTNARILVGFAAEQNYSVCAVQFFFKRTTKWAPTGQP